MSSSYVEVREAENGTEENALPIAIDTCESNGIVPVSQIDGEPQKDHTYNKEPLEVQGEVEVLVSSEEAEEDMEVSIISPEKSKNSKRQRSPPSKKTNKVGRSPVKKESSKKSTPSPQKKVIVKEKDKPKMVKKEELVSDTEDELDVSLSEKDSPSPKKRGQKRKADCTKASEMEPKAKKEKLDVKKSKLVKSKVEKKEESDSKENQEQAGNGIEKTIEEKDDVKEAEEKSPAKPLKKNMKTPSKTPKKTASGDTSSEDDLKLPEGWTRKVVQRKSGKTAGQFDVYIYSPDGKKLRSRPDIAAYLAKVKSPLTVDDFNFNFSLKAGGGSQSTLPVKKSITTPVKTKSTSKATGVTGKKKTSANNSKKGMRLVVKLNFSPKKRILSNYEEQEKTEKHGDVANLDGKKVTPKKSSKRQKAQAKKKTPTKQTPSKK